MIFATAWLHQGQQFLAHLWEENGDWYLAIKTHSPIYGFHGYVTEYKQKKREAYQYFMNLRNNVGNLREFVMDGLEKNK